MADDPVDLLKRMTASLEAVEDHLTGMAGKPPAGQAAAANLFGPKLQKVLDAILDHLQKNQASPPPALINQPEAPFRHRVAGTPSQEEGPPENAAEGKLSMTEKLRGWFGGVMASIKGGLGRTYRGEPEEQEEFRDKGGFPAPEVGKAVGLRNLAAGGINKAASGLEAMYNPVALGQAGKAQGGAAGAAKEFIGRAGTALSNPNNLRGMGEMAGAVGGLAGKIPGVGPVFEAMGRLAQATLETIDKLKKMGEQLHEFNMQFAEFSGAMARVQAQQEVRDIQLNRERGDRLAESAGYLAEQKSRFNTAMAPWEDKWQEFKNNFWGKLFELGGDILKDTHKIANKQDEEAATSGPPEDLNDWMDKITNERFPKKTRKVKPPKAPSTGEVVGKGIIKSATLGLFP